MRVYVLEGSAEEIGFAISRLPGGMMVTTGKAVKSLGWAVARRGNPSSDGSPPHAVSDAEAATSGQHVEDMVDGLSAIPAQPLSEQVQALVAFLAESPNGRTKSDICGRFGISTQYDYSKFVGNARDARAISVTGSRGNARWIAGHSGV